MEQLQLGDISVDVVQKDIKNIHLSVYPPSGRVTISAPLTYDLDTIRVFAISKLSWIKKQQAKIREQKREPVRDYINRESHYFRGERYLLQVIEQDSAPKVVKKHSTLELYVRPGASREKKMQVLDEWYRAQIKEIVPPLISQWENIMEVKLEDYRIRKMKTKWGSCNPDAKRIWLNLELAKKPKSCLEYIIVHEMVHLFERTHNERFIALMDHYMPQWRLHRDELNNLPVSHVDWGY